MNTSNYIMFLLLILESVQCPLCSTNRNRASSWSTSTASYSYTDNWLKRALQRGADQSQ